jgi:predicted dehydrogenase
MKYLSLLIMLIFMQTIDAKPLKLGVVGLSHGHVGWILGYDNPEEIEVVGYVETNMELAKRFAKQYGFSMDMVYPSIEALVAAKNPEAVAAFGSTYEHLGVVQKCAPLGIHVMVEKPLAVSVEHVMEMKKLAKENNIYLITNYETTWYPTNHKARELLDSGHVGDLRKVIVYDGHRGPKKIGVDKEFLDWLADPVLNGGGAITDFGCYGANLLTWLHKGVRPNSVTAIKQQFQAENNPEVEDESIIILQYDHSNALLQPSWNWPMGRKDMEIYGLTGAIYSDNRHDLRVRIAEGYDGFSEEKMTLEERDTPFNEPFEYFAKVISGEIQMEDYDLSSLENNVIVVEILEAAKKSAETGKTIYLNKK